MLVARIQFRSVIYYSRVRIQIMSTVTGLGTRPVVARVPAIQLHYELQRLIEDATDIEVIPMIPEEANEEVRRKVSGLIIHSFEHSPVDKEFLDLFPNLRVISNFGVGYNHIDVAVASARGITVGNTPGVPNDTTADIGFALLLASARNILEGDRIAKNPDIIKFNHLSNWFGAQVSGATIGIVGMGKIGCAVAKRAKGFDMKILYHNRNRREDDESVLGAQFCDKLPYLLNQSDFIMLCTPLTPETKNLIAAKELSIMKPTATLVNISRGGVVNQTDLAIALKNGTIRAAALDVTEPEPLPRDHALLKLPNVIITPHLGSATYVTRRKMMEIALMNLRAGLKGEKLPFGVN